MLDFFKLYAQDSGVYAILADSIMIIMAVLFSSYYAYFSLNNNIIITILLLYLIPYFINFS